MAETLVIHQHLAEITETIRSNDITVIRADTGSGKTMGVPYHLAFGGEEQNMLFCSVPTIASTLAAYNFQKKMASAINRGNDVGYACEGSKHYDDHTKVVYCTTGHLVNKVMSCVNDILNGKCGKWFTDILILDEFHIRTCQSDVIFCVWMTYYTLWIKSGKTLPVFPKLIIMSATINQDIIDLIKGVEKYSILSYSVPSHVVTTHYDTHHYGISTENLYIAAAKKAVELHSNDKSLGSYLVFVPGKNELEMIMLYIYEELKESVTLFGIHGEMDSDDIMLIMNSYPTRKIIIATNIAECSITVPGVTVVIDTLCHRVASSTIDESQSLDIEYISKSNSAQRRGRTGRTCPGDYYIMATCDVFNTLKDNVAPELMRVSITYEVLKLCKYGFNPINVLRYVLNENRVIENIQLLMRLGFVTEGLQSPFDASDMGEFCSKLPLPVKKSSMLYHLNNLVTYNDAFIYLAVVCTISVSPGGLFLGPKRHKNELKDLYKDRIDEARGDYYDKFAGYSDIDTIINVWTELIKQDIFSPKMKKFCNTNYINFKSFRETMNMIKKCQYSLHKKYNLNRERISIDSSEISKTLYHVLVKTHPEDIARMSFSDIIGINGDKYKLDRKGVRQLHDTFSDIVIVGRCSFNVKDKQIHLVTMCHSLH
jgi:HrpA-like RNA helicase